MGRKDAKEMLRNKVEREIFTNNFWDQYDEWLKKEEDKIDKEYQLGPETVLKENHERKLENLSAARIVPQINGILKTSQKLLGKYREEKFYKVLRMLKIHWLLRIFKMFLWLVRNATAHVEPSKDGRDISTLSALKSGMKSRFGFICIGIGIGFLLSFFLPDMFRDAFVYLKKVILQLS
jgi:hypothetical protein